MATRLAACTMLVILAGCGRARIDQFDRFAQAGIAYSEAVTAVTLEAANLAVDADSAALSRARETLPTAQRISTVREHDDLLRERVELLGDLRRHAGLLQRYFRALGALAGSDAPGEAAAAAEDLAAALGELGARLRGADLGGDAIGSFSGSVVAVGAARFQRRALERELEARAPLLEREIDLQQAAMQAIAAEMRTDLEALLGHQELSEIIDPYAADTRLPARWAKRRREILTATVIVESADAAASAAASLKRSFVALAEGRCALGDYQALLADIDEVVTLIERARLIMGGD